MSDLSAKLSVIEGLEPQPPEPTPAPIYQVEIVSVDMRDGLEDTLAYSKYRRLLEYVKSFYSGGFSRNTLGKSTFALDRDFAVNSLKNSVKTSLRDDSRQYLEIKFRVSKLYQGEIFHISPSTIGGDIETITFKE